MRSSVIMDIGMALSFVGIGLMCVAMGLIILTHAMDMFAEHSYRRRRLKAWGKIAIEQAEGRKAFDRLCDEVRESAAKEGL